jgi:hypothetical protein
MCKSTLRMIWVVVDKLLSDVTMLTKETSALGISCDCSAYNIIVQFWILHSASDIIHGVLHYFVENLIFNCLYRFCTPRRRPPPWGCCHTRGHAAPGWGVGDDRR